jgi:PadR family transcriptional regulator PadR
MPMNGTTAGQPKHFLQACLLLLLQEQPDYGYDLVARLRSLGVDDDSGTVYRALRSLERTGGAESRWKAPAAGPARRIYNITAQGSAELDEWADALDTTRKALDGFLTRHGRARADTGDEGDPRGPSVAEPARREPARPAASRSRAAR